VGGVICNQKRRFGNMNKHTLFAIISLTATTILADQSAITDTGELVILKEDGTWEYSTKPLRSSEISTNKRVFTKPTSSSFLVKSKKNKRGIWINPKIWSFKKATGDNAQEYMFQLKDEDLYAMVISEAIEIGTESLVEIALQNAKRAAPDAKIHNKEYRIVNGKKLIYLEITGTMQSINFKYHGYYYSDASGTTQLVTYTSTNLVEKYRSEITNFLNGMVTW
jgi:hypothetical protein